MEYFIQWGYIGLFVSAFLAASILPLGSEVVLAGLLLIKSFSPVSLLLIATLGNVLGSLTNYFLGYWASLELLDRRIDVDHPKFQGAENLMNKYGIHALWLSWLPVIGDPLTVLAGFFKLRLTHFLLVVSAAKFLRYVVLIYLVLHVGESLVT